MNDKLATRIFGRFDPIQDKVAMCWQIQAEMEEVFSLLEPKMKADPELENSCEWLAITTNRLKILVAEILEDLEVSRWDFAWALVKFSEMEEPIVFHGQMNFPNSSQFTSESDDDLHLP